MVFIINIDVFGQPGFEPPPQDDEPNRVPIDGGLLWLILGGAGLGVRRLMKNKKKEKVN